MRLSQFLVGVGGLEPPTKSLGNSCSIHLSYTPRLRFSCDSTLPRARLCPPCVLGAPASEPRLRAPPVEPDRPRVNRVDPEMRLAPRISCERGADGFVRLGFDGEYHAMFVAERPAQDDEARVHEP